jgi:hypothetical protein
MIRRYAVWLVALSLWACELAAAPSTIRITVHVRDQNNDPLSGARVFVRQILVHEKAKQTPPPPLTNSLGGSSPDASGSGIAEPGPSTSVSNSKSYGSLDSREIANLDTVESVDTRILRVARPVAQPCLKKPKETCQTGDYDLDVEGDCELCEVFVQASGFQSWMERYRVNSEEYWAILSNTPVIELSRAIIGFEQAGLSAVSGVQRFFFDLNLEVPFTTRASRLNPDKAAERSDEHKSVGYSDLGPWFRAFGTTRITTVPQKIDSSVAEFAAQFTSAPLKVKVSEAAQAFEVFLGTEMRPALLREHATAAGEDHLVSLSFVTAFGFITPFSPDATIQAFKVPTDLTGLHARFPDVDFSQKQYVALVTTDRDRFFRQFYGGLRLKTHYFVNGQDTGRDHAHLDLLYGRNEAVTGGRMSKGVVRIDGSYALPIGGQKRYLSLYGTGLLVTNKGTTSSPLILEAVDRTTITIPSAGTALITLPQPTRDYYRIGIGLNFMEFFRKP